MPSVPLQNEKMCRFIENCYRAYSSTLFSPSSHRRKKNCPSQPVSWAWSESAELWPDLLREGWGPKACVVRVGMQPPVLAFPASCQSGKCGQGGRTVWINKHTNPHEGYWCVILGAKKKTSPLWGAEFHLSVKGVRRKVVPDGGAAAARADGRLIWDAVWTRSTSSLSSVQWTL